MSIDTSLPARRPPLDIGRNGRLLLFGCVVLVSILTIQRGIFAAAVELRVDEAYYWTWSRENVISYLDHPPMVAWGIRLGTGIFGDTNFGVRSCGLLAMLAMQLLLADIVWQTLHDVRYVVVAVLLPEASLDYGLLMAKVAPDTMLIPFALGMVWSLIRLARSGDPRWWLVAGLFGGLASCSKYTAILLLPAIIAYAAMPGGRTRHFASPYFWLGGAIAIAVFAPVLYWNALHDWASFRFTLERPAQIDGWTARYLLEFIGQQFVLVGPLMLPVIVIATSKTTWRGCRASDCNAILLAVCVIFPLAFFGWVALSHRIGDSWPLFIWPFGFAVVALNLKLWADEAPASRLVRIAPAFMLATLVSGIALVVAASDYYVFGSRNYFGLNDPIGKEAGFGPLAASANVDRERIGASWFATTDYRIYAMLRWHLRDRIPVIQINERSRYIGFDADAQTTTGPIGLYIAPEYNLYGALWPQTSAVLKPVDEIDLTWRGVRYDRYRLQRLTEWKPVLAPPRGDPFYNSAPH